jgi:putative transposase
VDWGYYRHLDDTRGGFTWRWSLIFFSRRVIGWAMAASANETLVEMAFRMALQQRHPPAGLLHHTDRGCQYTSTAYQTLLAEKGVMVSMSRKGNCWDNAVTESFFGTLKGECVDLVCFHTRTEARQTVFEFVECYYNRIRRHSSLGYKSPAVYEQLMW